MKRFFYFIIGSGFFLLMLSSKNSQAQLTVVEGTALGMTPLQLVQDVLVGSGVTVSNATFNGNSGNITSNMIGKFTTNGGATTQLGFTGGILITSGRASLAIGPNSSGSSGFAAGTGSDPDLQLLIPSHTVYDKAVLQFYFVPISDTVRFRYVFGSEEFDEFCNTSYNDVFGFFISGPGISGPFSNNAKNIALMPNNPNNYVTINNVCAAGATWSWLNSGGQFFQYDRLTKVYTAWSVVQPCQQYLIKLAVGDAGDQIYDSGVFLEENSFSSYGLSFNTTYSSNIDTVAVEGCNNAIISFILGKPATYPIVIHYTIQGDAIEGVDYPSVPDSLIILPGQDSTAIVIEPIADGIAEPMESVIIIYQNSICQTYDTIVIQIKDYTPLSTIITPEVHNCNGQPATLEVIANGGFSPIYYEWSDNAGNTPSVVVNPQTPQMYYVTVSDECGYFTLDSVKVSISNLTTAITDVDSVTCFGYTNGSATVTAYNGIEPYSYIWSPTNDNTPTTSNLAAGTYFVTVTDAIGCTSTNFVILPSPPQIGLVLTPVDQTCPNYCNGTISSNLTGNYSQPVTYQWNTSPPQNTATATNLCPGNYTLTVTYSVHNCSVVANASIGTQTTVTADFISNPSPAEGYVPLDVQFTYTGTGAVTYQWDFGDPSSGPNNTSTLPNPTHTYNDMGEYFVTLVVSSGPPNFCQNEKQMVVKALQPSSINVPNIITPNGDGYNDVFQIESEGIEYISIDIFNRWGKKIFSTSFNDFSVKKTKKEVWDGTSKSDGQCADGTYFYIIYAKGYDKKEYNLKGTITLLR